MQTSFLTIICCLIAACGQDICANADYYLEQGPCVHTNGHNVSRSDLEAAIDIIIDELPELTGSELFSKESLQDAISQNYVAINFKNPDDHKGTFTHNEDGSMVITLKHYNCIAFSSLVHEFLHLFLVAIDGDYSHRDGWFGYETRTHQYLLDKKIRIEVCGFDY